MQHSTNAAITMYGGIEHQELERISMRLWTPDRGFTRPLWTATTTIRTPESDHAREWLREALQSLLQRV